MSSALFNSLGNATRIEIIHVIHAAGELSVNEVTEKIGISQSNTSRHLLILKDAGAVDVECQDNRRVYRVRPKVITLIGMADEVFHQA